MMYKQFATNVKKNTEINDKAFVTIVDFFEAVFYNIKDFFALAPLKYKKCTRAIMFNQMKYFLFSTSVEKHSLILLHHLM